MDDGNGLREAHDAWGRIDEALEIYASIGVGRCVADDADIITDYFCDTLGCCAITRRVEK